jgi:hypothetical protein
MDLANLHKQSAVRIRRGLSEFFQQVVLDEPYRLRLQRHCRMFRAELVCCQT